MSLVLSGSTSGSVTLQEPAVAGTTTLNLPATSGTVVVTGTTPTLNGITFPATQVPSADANTLDDYEEGNWTPVFGVPSGFTISTLNSAFYTKIGNSVTVQCYLSLTGTGNSSDLLIDGLPFVAKTSGYWTGILDLGVGGVLGAYVRINTATTECQFLYSGGGTSGSTTASRVALKANQCGANYIIFSITYFV
jgi:hypothetical protein